MAYTVALPDGRTVEFPDSVSRDQAAEIIKQQLGIRPGGGEPESGGTAAFKAGLESLKGSGAALLGKTGIMDIDAAAKYQKEKEAEAQSIFKPTEKGWTEAPLTKLAELGGGSLPYMLAPIAAGAATAALPLTGTAATIAGLGATGLTSLAQFTGTNLGRQIQEGKTLQQTELAPAALAALPQAALDVLPLGYLPGVRQLIPGIKQIFAKAGKEIPDKVAEQIAKQGTISTLKDYGATALKSMGAEGVTEAGQQFFERLQAGLSLTDEKARSEYFDNFIGGAVLGGTLAPAGRYVERGQIAAEQAKARREEEAKTVQQQQALAEQEKVQQEAYRQTDPYLADVQQRYNAMQEQYRKLIEATSVKPAKDDLAGQAQLKEARKALNEFKQDNANGELATEYAAVSKRIEAKQTEQEQARLNAEGMKKQGAQADLFGAPTQTDQTPLAQIEALAPRIKDLDTQIAAAQKEGDQQKLAVLGNQRQQLQSTFEPLLPSRQDLTEARSGIARMQEATKARMQEAKTDDEVMRHAQQLEEHKQALAQLDKYEPHVAPAPELDREKNQTTINKLRASLENAKTLGDHEQVLNIMPKLKELEAQTPPQLFETTKAGFAYPEIAGDKALAEEIAAGRQRAAKLRESLDTESAKLRGFAERKDELTPFQIGLAKQRLEDARRLRDQFAVGEQDWSKLKQTPENTQYQKDRTDLQKTLKERIADLQKELGKAPEAPVDAETFGGELAALKDRVLQDGEKPPRFKPEVKKELDATQQSLADLQSRIAIGEKYRQKGAVADNIITKETDARVADLLDRLLPGAIKPTKDVPAAPRRVTELPIQSAQDQLNKLKDAQALLKSLNKQIQAAGKPTDPAKIESLDILKEQRKDVQREAASAQKTYNRLAELEQPGAAPKAEPTQGDLFGGVQEAGNRLAKTDAQLEKLHAEFKAAKAEMTRRGQEATTPQLQELLDKFAKTPAPRIQELQAEIEKLEDQRASISGERSKQYADYLSLQEQEAPAPEQRSFDKRLTGFKEAIVKAPTKEELDAARTEYVELQTIAESIRSAISKQTSDGGKALREAATRLQVELESKTQEFGGTFGGFRKKSTVTEANAKALQDEYAPRIKRLLNMANMAAAAKKTGTIPKALETALEKATADQAKVKETVDKLEAQQRMAEQQQAVITGATPGEAEAQRLLAGKGYRTAEGFVRTAPKKKESWGITSVPKAKEAKPSEIAKAASEIEKAKSLIAATKKAVEEKNVPANLLIGKNQSKLAALQKAVNALDPQANDTFAPEKSADIFTEIQDLQEEIGRFGTQEQFDGLSAIIKGIDIAREKGITRPTNLYLAPFKRYEGMVKNTEAQVDALDAKLNQLKTEYDTAIKNEGKKAPVVVQAAVEDVINRATVVDKSHTKALLAYKIARRDMLAYQYEMGKDVREQYRAAVQALQAEVERQGKDTAIPAAIKERDAAVAKLQDIQDRLAKAEAKLQEAKGKERARVKAAETLPLTATQTKEKADEERRLAILRGESTELQKLPLMRVERDTTTPLAQAVQANAKRMLGMSQAALEKATTNAEKEEATLMVQRYERELAEAYTAGERKVTTEGGYAGKADVSEEDVYELQQPETGERLAPRKEGPLVREARQAPGQFIGAALDVKQGSRNPPRQAGVIKLRASDLDPSSANAISLFVTKGKLEGAKEGKSKDKLEAAYKNATEGLTETQIAEQLAEGKRLLSTGESLEVIAANEKRRQARLELVQAESYLRTAKTPAAKEIAQDDIDMKQAAYDAADRKYEAVKTAAAAQKFKGTEQADAAVEADIEETEKSRTRRAIEDSEDLLPTEGSTNATALSEDALGELYNGSLIYSLKQIAKSSPTDFIRENANKLEQFVRKTKVELVPVLYDKDGKSIAAAYNPVTNTVVFTKMGLNENDVIHEVTHAATMTALTMPEANLAAPQLAAKRELTAIFNKMSSMRRFKDSYATKNLKEFVSEVQSNVDLRTMMDKQPWYKGTIFEGFVRAVQRLLGIKPLDIGSARTAKLIEDLYMNSRTLDAEQVSAAPRVESAFIGTQAGKWETLKGNLFGLSGRVQLVDRLAAVDEALVKAEGAGKLSETEAFQTQYFMRLADNTTQAAGQFITNGPIRIVSEKRSTGTEYRYQSETGATLVRMSEFLEQASKAGIESPAKAEIIATAIIAGERAQSVPNGWSRLFAADPAAAKAEYDGYVAYLNANPEAKKYIDATKAEYKKYNDGLMNFAMDCDYISPEDAAAFKRMPYIPFYRIDNGNVKLFTDKEHSITIGNIKDNPDLAKMVGDNKHIMPLLTSAVQNTFMLTRVSMANKATHETASSLYKAGFSTKMGKGSGLASVNTVHYKIKGKPAFAVIDADTFGIPAHLIVKGMEGIKTTIPALVQMMGIPADVLRKFVTRTPAYAARQLIRDPVNAFMLGGVDGVPMVGALKEMAKMRAGTSESEQALMRGLAISSNVYSGNEKDMQKFLSDIASGKGKWTKMLGMLDTMALQADAATRATIYQDSLNKGFSEAQAQFRALESQNFSRRGLSPSMQMLSTLIPFFNAQVQGLDVLYRSLRGKMPFNERLDIRRKIAMRGAMLTTVAIAYALAMQDDDAYKKASPEERYNNFFVRIPGVKDPLKIPIPYEIGILFKALPEAILDAAMRDTTAKEAALGMGKLILQSAPGAIPLSGKPIIEAYYGATSQGPIESPREQELKAPYRYRETTTEVAKLAGSFTGAVGVSPIMLEHLVRGYTGSLGLAALHMLDPILSSSGEGEKASLSAAQQPFIGGMFQRAEGRWLIDRAYNRMDAVVQAQKTFDDLVSRGRKAEAKAFAQQYSTDLMLADDAGSLRKEMGELFSLDRAIRSDPRMSTAEKDKRLERIKLLENRLAEQFVTAVDKTRLQYARP